MPASPYLIPPPPRVLLAALLASLVMMPGLAWAGDAAERSAPKEETSAAETEFLKINYVFNRELYELAIPRYLKLLEMFPHFEKKATVHYALALSYHALAADAPADTTPGSAADRERRARREGAVKHARLALKDRAFASRREAMDILARDLLHLEQHDAARKVFQALYAQSKGKPKISAALGLADTEYRQGRYPAAATAYRQVLGLLEAMPDTETVARASFHLALSLYELDPKQVREARDRFEKLAAAPGTYRAEARYMTALASQKLDDQTAALAHYRRLGKESAARWQETAIYGEGVVLFHLDKFAESAAILETFATRFPGSTRRELAELTRGRALLQSGKVRTGARILNALRTSKRVGAEASLHLARAYSSKTKHSQSIKITEAAISKYPRSPHREILSLELAIELIAERRFEDARQALADFRTRYPDSRSRDHADYLAAYALHQAGEREASAAACRRFLEAHPDSRFARDVSQLEAENAFLSARYEEAGTRYAEYVRAYGNALSPTDLLLARYRMAEALYFRGEHADAVRAMDALAAGELATALDRATRERPVFAAYHYLLGEAAYQEKDYARAVRELRAFLSQHAGSKHTSDARFKLGHALQLQGDVAAARDAYAKALESDPESPHQQQIHFELGQAAMKAGDHARASEAFRQVVEKSPDSPLAPHALHFLGWIAQQGGRDAEASGWYQKLVDGFPNHALHAEGLYLLALSLQAESRFEEARKILQRLQTEHPGNTSLQRVKLQEGIALSREGRAREALEVFDVLALQTLAPELAALLHYEQAWCFRALKQPDRAIAAYRRILAMETSAARRPESAELLPTARLELAELEFDQGRFRQARELLTLLVDGENDTFREKALYRLCWCHHREGNGEALFTTYEKYRAAYARSERLVEVALLVARAHLAQSDFEKASKIFTQIVEQHAGTEEAELAMVSLGECLNEQRKFPAAKTRFQAFFKAYPKSRYAARGHFGLGWAEENLHDVDAALGHYKQANTTASEISARAQFQIGQCLAAKEAYDDAIVEFLQVEARFSYPVWASRATLQVAGCFEALEDHAKARKYYSEVVKKYANRDEARLAEERLAKLP